MNNFFFLQVDKNAEMVARWNYCALSQEKLRQPIVACELGRYECFHIKHYIKSYWFVNKSILWESHMITENLMLQAV